MKLNGIDPNLQAQAKQLLQSKEKVDHSREDLEVLWEYTKQTQEIDVGGASDEDIIAMFDVLDTDGNTLKNALALLLNAISDGAVPKVDDSTDTPAPPAVNPDDSTNPPAPPVVNPDDSTDTPAPPAVNPDDTTTKPGDSTTNPPVVPDDEPGVGDDNPFVPPGNNDDTQVDNTKPGDDTNVDNDTTTKPGDDVSAPDTDNTTNNTPGPNEKMFVQLYPKGSQTLEINGKTFVIDNQSKTSNNFAYYMKDNTLIIEGSDLKVSSASDDVADDIKVMGNRNTVDMKNGDDEIEIEGDMNMIYAGDGSDFVKIRGDMNSVDLGTDADTVWIAGNNNQAHGGDNVKLGAEDGDNFFAMGASNNLFGQEGVDAAYYNTTDAVEGMFTAGVGQELRIEEKITDGTEFENWVKGDDDIDGPPYEDLPKPLDGHEVRAYDDNTYTDKYEKEPLYYTEYRDIAYRELSVMTTENKETGEGTVTKYDDAGAEESKVTINPDKSVVVSSGEQTITIPADQVTFYDNEGNVVQNTGSMESTLEKLATGKLDVGDKNGVTLQSLMSAMVALRQAESAYENNQDPSKETALKANVDKANAELQKLLNG